MDDLKEFCCLNKNCPKHGIRGEDNVRLRSWYGKNKDIRLLYCRVCKKKFSERQGTPLFDSRLPRQQVASIVGHLVDGNGLRKTGHLTGADYRTAKRYARIAGEGVERLRDELVATPPMDSVLENRTDSICRADAKQQSYQGKVGEMPRAITKPLDKAIENAAIALDKIDYMLWGVFEWEIKDVRHVKQDLADAIETMKNVKQIVEKFYKTEWT